MKRLVSFLLVLVLLMASVPAIAVFDGWKLDYFQDDFGDPTDQFFLYISVPAAVTGAGNIEVAVATVVISENLAAISLDGVYQKIDTSYKEYTVSVKDGKGKKYSFSGKRDNSGVIIVGSGRTDFSLDPTIEKEQKEFDTFCDILVNGGDIQFVVKPLDAPNLKYSFTITATDPIMEKYPTTSAGDFRNGVASVTKLKTGLIDRTGNIIVPYKWKRIDPFLDGLAQVSNGEKIGFIDTTGNLVIPCEWEFAGGFCEGLSTVMKDDKYGYIDKTGKLVIPCEWDYASHFSEGLAWVKKDGKEGYIDTTGKLVIHDAGQDVIISSFKEGLLPVVKHKKYGYIDTTGKLVIPCEWEYADEFSEGLAKVEKDGKYGYIDKTGKLVIPCEWKYAADFSEGLAGVRKDGKVGYIDTTGKLVIPCEWGVFSSTSFSEGLAKVEKDGKYGYIDKTGKLVIPCEWERANFSGNFSEGLASVKKDGKYGYIDKTGQVVFWIK